MAVNWSLAAQPVNPLQALQAFGMAQQQQQQRIQQEQEQAQRQREFQLRERQAGLQERKFTQEQEKEAIGQLAQIADNVLRNPNEAQRGRDWDGFLDEIGQRDPSVLQYKGRYSDRVARSILAKAGQLDAFNKSSEVDYQVIPAGGRLQGFRFGVPLQQQSAPAQPVPETGRTIDQTGAAAMRQSLGEAGYQQWKQRHAITEIGGNDVPPPAGFVLDQ